MRLCVVDLRWKNPQGGTLSLIYLWAQDLIKELRKGSYLSRGVPYTKTGDFTLADHENWVIIDNGATTTITLPAAGGSSDRFITIKTVQAQTVVSASANVVPLAGGAAGTAILAATAGKWATLVSDGTNWVIMAAA
jgi:hypothetical protein